MIPTFCKPIHRLRSCSRFYSSTLKILGIESSCDDTAAAVLDDTGKILGEGHFSQARFHVEAGGVLPVVANKLHAKYVKTVVETAMKNSSLNFKDLDAIAVTIKPGLILSLLPGVEYAKDLCTLYNKPLIPIHHMEAHALTGRLVENVNFPFLTLLISGGHCLVALVESASKFYTLGKSLDNSPGLVLDKVARRARLKNVKRFRGLVGGAAIEAAAVGGNPHAINQTCRVMSKMTCFFSFSGFYSQSMRYIDLKEKELKLGPDQVIPDISDLCASLQWGMSKHLCQVLEVIMHYVNEKNLILEDEKCLVVSGGVASNQFFRKALKSICDYYHYRIVIPPQKYCTDNGVMIAWNGIEKLRENLPVVQPTELSSVEPLAKCPLGEDLTQEVEREIPHMNITSVKLKKILQDDESYVTKIETG